MIISAWINLKSKLIASEKKPLYKCNKMYYLAALITKTRNIITLNYGEKWKNSLNFANILKYHLDQVMVKSF